MTDLDGNFNLTVASNSTIVISFIGYSDQNIVFRKDNTVLNVNLKEDTEMIDEVVVVGYGVQKKENLTGSVAAVNFKDVASMPVANTANMLQGRLPGVMLTNNGAQAGHDSPEIRIRGVGTFEHNDPMVLIDGVESSVSQIVESLQMILKVFPCIEGCGFGFYLWCTCCQRGYSGDYQTGR